jgi:hypothetical protein
MVRKKASIMQTLLFLALAFYTSVTDALPRLVRNKHELQRAAGSPLVLKGRINSTAEKLFEEFRQQFERTDFGYGRTPTSIAPSQVSLDFELETNLHTKLTPEILIQRSGITHGDSRARPQVVWPKLSKYFHAGVDGTGAFYKGPDGHRMLANRSTGDYRQSLSALIELESVVMSPAEVVGSSFLPDIQKFLQRTWAAQKKHQRTTGKSSKKSWPLPIGGSKGIQVRGGIDPDKKCTSCYLQWTAGLELKHVSDLLRMTGDRTLTDVLAHADKVCSERANGCDPEYHAFLSMAAFVMRKARSCGCVHPKWCMKSWLVRTHFGDMLMHLKDTLGDSILENVHDDILAVGQFNDTDPVLPKGTIDYMKLPEIAEFAGLVYPRSPLNQDPAPYEQEDLPTDFDGLLKLSKRVVASQAPISNTMKLRNCSVHGRSTFVPSRFTVKDWIDGLKNGQDLMSDHDSEISKASFSHTVWRSMGSWRMEPDSDRVYLECRSPKLCMRSLTAQKGPAGLMRDIASRNRIA